MDVFKVRTYSDKEQMSIWIILKNEWERFNESVLSFSMDQPTNADNHALSGEIEFLF